MQFPHIWMSRIWSRKVSLILSPHFPTLQQQCTTTGTKTFRLVKEETIASHITFWVLLNRAPSSIHLHPAPSTSTQVRPPPPSSLQHPQQYLNQNIVRNWAISPNLGQKIKSCPIWMKIGTRGILEVLIPNSDFLKFRPQNPFLGKFGPKYSKLSVLPENWCTYISRILILNPDLDFWNFDPKIHFSANFSPKIQSCPFCLKIGALSISRILIPNPDLDFWNFDLKIHFWANLGPKSQSCPFCLKIGTHGISRMLILIPTLVFWISNPNFLFGQIWAKKVKVVRFNWKLAHMISRGCWFLFQH